MSINNRFISLIYRLSAFILGFITIISEMGVLDGELRAYNLFYFTIISNIFCMCLFLALSIKTIIDIKQKGIHGNSSISSHIKGEVTISIILTMSIYHFILIPYALKQNPYQTLHIRDVIFHYIIPILTIYDWILFDEKKRFKWYDPFIWTLGPYLYVAFIYIQAQFDVLTKLNSEMSKYVYIFLDIGKIGFESVLQNIVLITFVFIIIGYFIYGIDRIKFKKN